MFDFAYEALDYSGYEHEDVLGQSYDELQPVFELKFYQHFLECVIVDGKLFVAVWYSEEDHEDRELKHTLRFLNLTDAAEFVYYAHRSISESEFPKYTIKQ